MLIGVGCFTQRKRGRPLHVGEVTDMKAQGKLEKQDGQLYQRYSSWRGAPIEGQSWKS